MTNSVKHQAVIFADIVGSSKLYVNRGNLDAKLTVEKLVGSMAAIVRKNSGRVVKTLGDEILAVFDDSIKACEAATAIHATSRNLKCQFRIAISSGDVINGKDAEGNKDVFGDTVNCAAFLAKIARGGQTIVCNQTQKAVLDHPHFICEFLEKVTIKGDSKNVNIYRLSPTIALSQTLDATVVAGISGQETANRAPSLMLWNNTFRCNLESNRTLVFGRDESVDFCIDHPKTSRRHCSISYKNDQFFLEDHSTNGTFVFREDNTIRRLKREQLALEGNGHLQFGERNSPMEYAVHYKLK